MANKKGTRTKAFVLTFDEFDKVKEMLDNNKKKFGSYDTGREKKETETSVLLRLLGITKEPFWYEI